MANSIKETKVLFEGFRRFAIKEVEAEKPAGSGEIVRIFDFDGTVVQLADAFKEIAGPAKHFLQYLRPYAFKIACAKLLQQTKGLPALNTLRDSIAESPDSTYIYSMVTSGGLPKDEETFLRYLMGGVDAKGEQKPQDQNFVKFMNLLFATEKEKQLMATFDEEAELGKEAESDEEVDYDETADFYDLDEAKKSPEQALQDAGNQNLNAAKALLKKYFTFKGDRDNQQKMAIQKGLIKAVLKENKIKINPNKIIVRDNLGNQYVDEKTSAVRTQKGTSGKVGGAEQISKLHPNAAGFEVYDNKGGTIAEIEKGIRSGKSEEEIVKKMSQEDRTAYDKLKSDLENPKITKSSKKAVEDAIKKLSNSALNIKTFKVDEATGEPFPFYGAIRGHESETGKANPAKVLASLVQKVFNAVEGKGVFDGERKQAFIEYMKSFPNIASLINYRVEAELSPQAKEKGALTTKFGKKAEIPNVKALDPTTIDISEWEKNNFDREFGRFVSGLSAVSQKVRNIKTTQPPESTVAVDTKSSKVSPTEPPAESIYEELDRLLTKRKYSFKLTAK